MLHGNTFTISGAGGVGWCQPRRGCRASTVLPPASELLVVTLIWDPGDGVTPVTPAAMIFAILAEIKARFGGPLFVFVTINSSYMIGAFYLRGWENEPIPWSVSTSMGEKGAVEQQESCSCLRAPFLQPDGKLGGSSCSKPVPGMVRRRHGTQDGSTTARRPWARHGRCSGDPHRGAIG